MVHERLVGFCLTALATSAAGTGTKDRPERGNDILCIVDDWEVLWRWFGYLGVASLL
jgi:hypothetical protein